MNIKYFLIVALFNCLFVWLSFFLFNRLVFDLLKNASNEIKKKTGVVVDQKGNILNQEELDEKNEQDPTSKLLNDRNQPVDNNKNKKEYTPIDEYTPSGNFVYKDDMLKKIEKRMNS